MSQIEVRRMDDGSFAFAIERDGVEMAIKLPEEDARIIAEGILAAILIEQP